MSKIKTHKEYLEILLEKKPNLLKEIEFLTPYVNSYEKMTLGTRYGLVKCFPNSLLKNKNITIESAIDKTEYFINLLKEKNFNFELIGTYENEKSEFLINTKYGVCCKKAGDLLRSFSMNIMNAVDKNSYFENQAREIHGDKYDYSLVEYTNNNTKIKIICPIHGIFKQTPTHHLDSHGCKKCGNITRAYKKTSNIEKFIKKANIKHNNKYDYSLSVYKNKNSNVQIICPIHGVFPQQANGHLQGNGCKKCGLSKVTNLAKENPTGWSLTHWIKSGSKSKNFDSFKVYIIRCWNNTEEFYKIGRTFTKTSSRFKDKQSMPYNYEIVKELLGIPEYVYKLETILKKLNKEHKYTPKIKFKGENECFSKVTIL